MAPPSATVPTAVALADGALRTLSGPPSVFTVVAYVTGFGGVQGATAVVACTYAWEMYPPLATLSHWAVVRTVPVTVSPLTWQVRLTGAPLATVPTLAVC